MNFANLQALMQKKQYAKLIDNLAKSHYADIGEFINQLDTKESILVFRLLPKKVAAEVFAYLDPESQAQISMQINEKELHDILNELYFDDKIDFLEEMPANVVKRILRNSPESERKLINQFLNYPEDSAGSLMTIEFVDLKKEMTVEEALARIREIALDRETIYTCYGFIWNYLTISFNWNNCPRMK